MIYIVAMMIYAMIVAALLWVDQEDKLIDKRSKK